MNGSEHMRSDSRVLTHCPPPPGRLPGGRLLDILALYEYMLPADVPRELLRISKERRGGEYWLLVEAGDRLQRRTGVGKLLVC